MSLSLFFFTVVIMNQVAGSGGRRTKSLNLPGGAGRKEGMGIGTRE